MKVNSMKRNIFGVAMVLISVFLLSGCGVNRGGSAPNDPTVKPEQVAKPFPRTFFGSINFFDEHRRSSYVRSDFLNDFEEYDFGCVESPDGRDFTFVMKATGTEDKASDLTLSFKNIFVRESKLKYRGMTDVTFDGYTRYKYFEFESALTQYQVFKCDADIERVKDFAKGIVQCHYVKPTRRSKEYLPNRLLVELIFQCDIVQR